MTYASVLLPQAIDHPLTYRVPPELEAAIRPGRRIEVPVRGKATVALVLAVGTEAPPGIALRDVGKALDDGPFFDAPALAFLSWVAEYYLAAPGLVLRAAWPEATRLVRTRAQAEEPPAPEGPAADAAPVLSAAQRAAADRVTAAVTAGGFAPFLAHGVTGSGKTEVYLAAAAAALAAGKGAIVLVPEITLAHQIVRWFRARFGDRVTVLHSRLTGAERGRALAAARGPGRIVVGARSALFAPVSPLGLVVVDEEHETAYKQEDSPPCYHARDAAIQRAKLAGCPVVLGSATPSLETAAQARAGRVTLLDLPARIDATPMPAVELVRVDARGSGHGALSPRLRTALTETVARGEQALLFLNRRGFAPVLLCVTCGKPVKCSACSTSMVLHAREGVVMCHWCGARAPSPRACPECGGSPLRALGMGTERVEAEVAELLPHAKLVRMDQDTTRKRTGHADLLGAFAEGDVLIGTQMIAKGLDFPRLALVGVILADEALYLPDFRAAERTFQLLTQVAGRAGRRDRQGRVIVQTWDPAHPAIRAAAAHDYWTFYEAEAALRKLLRYPPFGRLVRFRIAGKTAATAEQAARALAKAVTARLPANAMLLGPAPAMPFIVARTWRWHLVLKGPVGGALRNAARDALAALATAPFARQVRITADPDPVNVMS